MQENTLGNRALTPSELFLRGQEWGLAHLPNAIRIVLILAAGYVLLRTVRHLTRRVEHLGVDEEDPARRVEKEKRARTLARVLRQTASIVILAVVFMLVLGEMGVDLKPILAGAGIAGLAVGFGAQTMVKDVISGFFVLLENQFRVNDVIRSAGVEGLVEAINLRTTVLRDVHGRVHVIPNGDLGVVTNYTRNWSRALLDVGVAYKEDTDRCFAILGEVGASMERDPVFGPKLAGPFQYPGVQGLDESAVTLRVVVDTLPQERWNVLRELRRRVKKAFDEAGVEIPFPHRTLYVGEAPSRGSLAIRVEKPKESS